ncbi:hypothetical protein BT69DRAFT_1285993, partial [Atractiella rhizophila]
KQYNPRDKTDPACLVLDGVRVSVKLIDNGLEIDTTMVSGLVGTEATVDTASPLAG